MNIPVVVEVWQTETPDFPGTWRRTAKEPGLVKDGGSANDGEAWVKFPTLGVEPRTPWLRIEWKKNGESERYVVRYPVLEEGKTWEPVTLTKEIVSKGVLYVEDRGSRQVVMRVPLPKKPLLQTTRPTQSIETVRQRVDAVREAVATAGMDGEIRKTAMQILSGFTANVEPALVEVERQMREVARVTGREVAPVPLPTFEGLDERGRAHFQYKSARTDIDLYVGRERHVEIVSRGEFQLLEREQVTPESLMGAVFAGPVGEA